jgi:hypothetical protein
MVRLQRRKLSCLRALAREIRAEIRRRPSRYEELNGSKPAQPGTAHSSEGRIGNTRARSTKGGHKKPRPVKGLGKIDSDLLVRSELGGAGPTIAAAHTTMDFGHQAVSWERLVEDAARWFDPQFRKTCGRVSGHEDNRQVRIVQREGLH